MRWHCMLAVYALPRNVPSHVHVESMRSLFKACKEFYNFV